MLLISLLMAGVCYVLGPIGLAYSGAVALGIVGAVIVLGILLSAADY